MILQRIFSSLLLFLEIASFISSAALFFFSDCIDKTIAIIIIKDNAVFFWNVRKTSTDSKILTKKLLISGKIGLVSFVDKIPLYKTIKTKKCYNPLGVHQLPFGDRQ